LISVFIPNGASQRDCHSIFATVSFLPTKTVLIGKEKLNVPAQHRLNIIEFDKDSNRNEQIEVVTETIRSFNGINQTKCINFNGVNGQRSSFYDYFIPILIFNSSTVSMIVTIGYRYRWNREIVIASEKLVKRGLN